MIPCVQDILEMLLAGKCTLEQATAWIAEHINLAGDRAAEEGLRDYFAARAMEGVISTVPHLAVVAVSDVAREAYLYADAMLEARKA